MATGGDIASVREPAYVLESLTGSSKDILAYYAL